MAEEERGFSANDMLFIALVRDFESMAMVGFGKLVDPVSQKTERNIERARVAIDMLGMLEEKTKGNLDGDQAALLQQVLTNLRLNFLDEVRKEQQEAEKREAETAKEGAAAEAPGEPAETKSAPRGEERFGSGQGGRPEGEMDAGTERTGDETRGPEGAAERSGGAGTKRRSKRKSGGGRKKGGEKQ